MRSGCGLGDDSADLSPLGVLEDSAEHVGLPSRQLGGGGAGGHTEIGRAPFDVPSQDTSQLSHYFINKKQKPFFLKCMEGASRRQDFQLGMSAMHQKALCFLWVLFVNALLVHVRKCLL